MVGRTNVTGESLRSIIAVTYPEGSVCTCSNGTRTLKARGTSGKALFNVKAGTYTVECHTSDNSKSKSTSVTVTESDTGNTKSVTLNYELVLYDSGTDNTAVTGGWRSAHSAQDEYASGGGVTFNAGSMSFSSGYHKYGCLSTAKTINTSGYSTINFNITSYTASGYGDYLGLTSNRNAQPSSVAGTSISTGTRSVSIASAQGNYYVSIWADRNCTVVVSKIWLA